ncbi:MAG: hypothetical protein V5A55_12710 [Halovenus sp.]
MNRRAFLASGVALGAGLAGCVSDSDEAGSDDDDNGQQDGIASTTITTTETDCGGPDDDHAVADVGGGVVTVVGVLGAPDPCHEATIAAASIENGHLSLTVDVVEDLADDEGCAQCQGAIEYEATVEFDAGVTVDGGTTDHATGGTHEFDADDDGSPSIVRTELETTETACTPGIDGGVTVERTDGRVAIRGTFTAPNPCHEAVLEETTVDGDRLQVSVSRRSTLEEGEVCRECVGAISYEASIEVFPLDALEDVQVEHPDGPSEPALGASTRDE